LDWKRLAPHLARVFLDYEPGIHYPQLQMQAGTTGINAMRVYSVTKQGKDQDPTGKFIRRYVPELERVPDEYIHEPWKMPRSAQQRYNVLMSYRYEKDSDPLPPTSGLEGGWSNYPEPIVDEKESARIAKAKLSEVRKQELTRSMANQVYQKHGSRTRRSNEMNGRLYWIRSIAIST
jgi:deoxyribodipyrimidine photo-lyase